MKGKFRILTSRAAALGVLVLVTNLLPSVSHAQYPGDVTLHPPSSALRPGETAEVKVNVFAGAQVLGAVNVEISFDRTLLEATAVVAGSSAEFTNHFTGVVKPGRVSFIALNSASNTKPFGTVHVATVTLRAIGAPGRYAPLNVAVRGILDQDSQAFLRTGAWDGEVIIGSAVAATARSAFDTELPRTSVTDPDLYRRAALLAPPGSVVELWVESSGGLAKRRVQLLPEGSSSSEDESELDTQGAADVAAAEQ